jgi:hypothetical protein
MRDFISVEMDFVPEPFNTKAKGLGIKEIKYKMTPLSLTIKLIGETACYVNKDVFPSDLWQSFFTPGFLVQKIEQSIENLEEYLRTGKKGAKKWKNCVTAVKVWVSDEKA